MKLVYRFVATRRKYLVRKNDGSLVSAWLKPVKGHLALLTGTRIIAELRHRRNRSLPGNSELMIAKGTADLFNGGGRYFADRRYLVPVH